MYQAHLTRQPQLDQKQTEAAQEPMKAKRPVQRSLASIRQPLYTQLWGNQVPPGLRLSAPVQAGIAEQARVTPLQQQTTPTGLPDTLKDGMEKLSGLPLDDVQVHYNSPQPAQMQALAYTQGTQIHVGPGQEKHLGHEAWHVVQQKQGRVKPTLQMMGMLVNTDSALEKEADVLGRQVSQMKPAYRIQQPAVQNHLTTTVFQRKTESSTVMQMNGWSPALTAVGVGVGLAGAAMATGVSPIASLGAAAIYGGAAVVSGWLGNKIGDYLDYRDLKSQEALENFQTKYGGNSQGTLVFVQAGGKYYMIEQQTNNSIAEEAKRRGIIYLPQPRVSGYHAEMRFIAYALEDGIPRKGATIWVSKPICMDCKDVLEREGVTIKTATNNDQYHNWISPYEEGYTRVESTGVRKGHRTETERLLRDLPESWRP